MTTTVKWDDSAFRAKVAAAVDKGLLAAAIEGQAEGKRLLRLWSRPYTPAGKRKGARQRYIPSPPGSPPGYRLGNLHRSVQAELLAPGRAAFGTNVRYGRFLELGTSKMPARPWLRPAMNLSKGRMQARFTDTVRRALRAGGTA